MSQLTDLFEAVREEGLTKTQLEAFHLSLLNLHTAMEEELAEKEKEEARFLNDFPEEISEAKRKRVWKATPSGQRLIELKRLSKTTEKWISSVKHRIFSIY